MRCVARNIGEAKRENSLRSSQPSRTYSSTMHSAIVSTWPASPARPRVPRGDPRPSAGVSLFHPDRLPAQVAVHEVLLVSWGEAGAGRLPDAAAFRPAVLCLGDPDQRLLGAGVESVVVGFAPADERD